jgi:alpha-tubulin suppressor-like RCC1 family protein
MKNFIVILLLGMGFLSSCGKSDGLAPSAESPSLVDVSINPSSVTLVANNNLTFTASGGDGVYSYSIFSGSGSILSTTGAFTAPGVAGSTVVRVTDGSGRFADAVVTVNASLQISPSTTSLGLNATQSFSTSGGVPPIGYSLVSGGGSINSSTGLYTAGSSPGAAVVRATDSLGNTSDANINIFGSLGISPSSITVAVNNTVNFSAAGGVSPYTYSVFSGSGTINTSGVFTASASAGLVTVRVTDSIGATSDAFVTVNPALTLSPLSQVININDSLQFTASDGVPPYTFSILSGTGSIDSSSGLYTAPVSSGNAQIEVADSYGNTVTANIIITSPMNISPSSITLAVNNQTTFTVAGGTGPYTYSMVSGGGSINASTGVYTAPAGSGSAVVRVTDSLGATSQASISINPALAISPSAPTTSTSSGTIFFTAAGGVTPYTFSVLSGTGTINSSTGQYTAQTTAGSEVVRVTDAFGNTSDSNVTIVTGLGMNPAAVTVVANTTYSFSGLNGSAPYTYSMVSGGGSINATTGLYTAPATAGTAVVRVTDSTSATADANVTITPGLLISPTSVTLAVNNVFVFNASGGVSPYTYSIFSGGGSINASSGQFTAPASSGTTVVRVTDQNGNTSNSTVTINAALSISPSSATITVSDTRSYSASGGVSPYTYSLQSGNGSINATTGLYTPGTAGVKSIRVTDSLGNTSNASLTVNENLAITPTSAYVVVDSDYSLGFTGGVPPVSYSIVSGGGAIDSATGVYTAPSTTGSATVRVTDALGHTSDASLTMFNPLTISPNDQTIGINTVQNFTASGGVGALTFSIFSGNGSINPSTGVYTAPATAGTEIIQVTDSIGNTASATLYVVSALTISPTNLRLPVFSTATFSAVLGTAPYTYSIFSGSGTINSSTGLYTAPATAGSGVARVTDANSNTSDANITHIEPVLTTAGAQHTCALYNEGTVKCWGDGAYGQLGNGSTSDIGDAATEVGGANTIINLGTGRTAVSIATGFYHNCALLDNSQVKCWGYNLYGQLGRGNTANIGDAAGEMGDSLVAVNLGAGRTATSIYAFGYVSCAKLDNNTTKCWGRNNYGQLGLGNTNGRGDAANEMGDNLPAINFGTGRTASALVGGLDFTCALLDNSTVKCFGRNNYGQLGQGHANTLGDAAGEMGDALLAVNLGTGRTATQIASGHTHICAVLDNSTAKCWGRNQSGQLGQGSTTVLGDGAGEMGDSLPAISLGTGFSALRAYAGNRMTCIESTTGAVKCFGLGSSGQLLRGSTTTIGDAAAEMGNNLVAASFGTGFTVSQLSINWYGGCAITSTKRIKCWGNAANGRLLNASTTLHLGDVAGEIGDSLPFINH